jgi:superfamily I DNA and/or RNA helicase
MMPSSLFYYDRLKTAKDLGLDSLSYWVERLRAVEALTNSVEMEITEQSCQDEMHHYRTVHRQTWWPIHFRSVKGKDTSVALETFSGTDSWQNCEEADAAVEIIDALVQNGGVDPSRIGVMTPYRGQVVAVRQRCREKHYHDVNVGTIHNFQGVEQEVIILSLTRSNPAFVKNDVKKRMGVFGMPKQANVALTRAENLFIVVGNPECMWEDPLWRQWLLFCHRNGLWYGERLGEDTINSSMLNNAKFVSMLEQVEEESNGTDSIVVSTMEKIHRVHSSADEGSLVT